MSEAPVEVCITCGAGPVEKLLFPVAVHFKGSGFYSTDYGKGGRKSSAKDGGETSGGEKKPAEKAETTSSSEKTSEKKKPAADS